MECCQDGAGLLWLEGEKDSHSSHPPVPTPGCRGAQALHTTPWVYVEPAELRAPSPVTESVGWRSPVLCILNTCSMGCGGQEARLLELIP